MNEMKQYEVWIRDGLGYNEPALCECRNKTEARQKGREYIRRWSLVGAKIVRIEEMDIQLYQNILKNMSRKEAASLIYKWEWETLTSEKQVFERAALRKYCQERIRMWTQPLVQEGV